MQWATRQPNLQVRDAIGPVRQMHTARQGKHADAQCEAGANDQRDVFHARMSPIYEAILSSVCVCMHAMLGTKFGICG